MKSLQKICLIIFVVILIFFCIYLYKLHSLAVEGNKIFEERCTTVNPPLIAYKTAFLKFADAINNPKKYESVEYLDYLNEYIEQMRIYLDAERNWTFKNYNYIYRWDFKLFEPSYFKEVAGYQQLMYEGYLNEAKIMIERIDGQMDSDELSKSFSEARDNRLKYEDLYFRGTEKATAIRDWRKIFGNVPLPSGCTEENMRIPNTIDSINWDGPTPAPPKNPDTTG